MSGNDVTSTRVAILTGGWSDEREIAISSARACETALAAAGFSRVDVLDVADPSFLSALTSGSYDVAFVAMHGRYGEDGCVQGLLEILRIPYTFSGVEASATAADKSLSKLVYERAGIPTAPSRTLGAGERLDAAAAAGICEELGLPLFVKPEVNGSSYGITKVRDAAELPAAVELAGAEGGRVLVEAGVEGTEITVAVVGNEAPEALPVVEIAMDSDFYDLETKYEPSELHHVIPARLAADVYAHAQELAVRAHVALGCRGASRSDFIVTSDGTPVILETNTIPGMTETSLMPDAARHAGIGFPELCRRFVELALEGR